MFAPYGVTRAELKALGNGVMSYFTGRLKSREVMWRKQMSELGRFQVTLSPFSTRLLLQGFFSLQTDKMKYYSGVLCCSADQGVHVLSEIIINKGKKSRAAVP